MLLKVGVVEAVDEVSDVREPRELKADLLIHSCLTNREGERFMTLLK